MGFTILSSDEMYAILRREKLFIHLQWHADTEEDPLLDGSIIKIFVQNIHVAFSEMVGRETVAQDKLRLNTPWGTNEFGF